MVQREKEEQFFYLDVSQRDRRWNLYLNGTGRNLHHLPRAPDKGHPEPYYFHWDKGRVLPGLGVAYITQGNGEFETEETGSRVLQAGTMFFLFPGVWHRYRPQPGTGWSYHWLHFDGGYVEHLIRQKVLDPRRPILEIGLNSQVLRPFLTLQDRVRASPPGLQQLAAGNIIEILGSALATPPPSKVDAELQSLLMAAKETLDEQVSDGVDLEKLANSFGLSYNYFRRLFREHIGTSPYKYFLNLRLERAKQLLSHSDMTIKEIALSLHFDSPNYFSRIFQKKTGMSPSNWRVTGGKKRKK